MWMRIVSTAAVFTLAGFAADSPDAAAHRIVMPPVLRGSEPTDSGLLTLPGAPVSEAPPAPQARREFTMPPLPPPVAEPRDPLPLSVAPLILASLPKLPKSINPTSIDSAPPPAIRPARKPIFPPDFERDSAIYCQKRIGQ